MFLLLAIAGCGAWCLHQHWLRLLPERRPMLWPWVVRGFLFPSLVWAIVNFGFGDRFPPLVPNLAEAQATRQPWVMQWILVAFAGTILILNYWLAFSYSWLLVIMWQQAPDRREFAFNVGVFGFFTALCGGGLLYANGLLYGGSAVVLMLLPIVHFTLDLVEKAPPRPVYDRAVGQMKFGKYQAAEWELIAQLEKREDDFQGWMMMAELYARQHRNIEDAARVVLDVCQNPKTEPAEISIACHKLADWQMEIAENPEGARAALRLLCRKLPDTHFAKMAEQRMKQLPQDETELQQLKKPKRIRLPALSESDEEFGRASTSRGDAMNKVNQLVQKLTEDPNEIAPREKLADILAVDLGKVDQGIEQLRLLIDLPAAEDAQRAKWLGQIAAWELSLKRNSQRYAQILHEIIEKFPNTAQAFAAQRRLFLLESEAAVVSQKV